MKSKKTIIISSLIMCLTLIVAIVSVTAAWFGNVTQQQLGADLTVDSGTVSASADIQIDSGDTSGQSLYPAVAEPGYYLSGKDSTTFLSHAAPGNYGPVADFSKEKAQVLYPTTSRNPSFHLEKEANLVTYYLTIKYLGPADEGSTDGKKSVELALDGVFLASALTLSEDGKYEGFDNKNIVDYKNEFNVNMSLVNKIEGGDTGNTYETVTSCGDISKVIGNQVYYNNDYTETNPYGHVLKMRLASSVVYTVKFEIYFNKIDEECNPDLLNTKLVLHIKLDQDVNFLSKSEG